MIFKKTSAVNCKGVQVDNFLLEIPFNELPYLAVEEYKENYITCPAVTIDYEEEKIVLEEEITHG